MNTFIIFLAGMLAGALAIGLLWLIAQVLAWTEIEEGIERERRG